MSETEQADIVAARRQAWDNLSDEGLNRVLIGQEMARTARIEKATEKYDIPGPPAITPNVDVWKCYLNTEKY